MKKLFFSIALFLFVLNASAQQVTQAKNNDNITVVDSSGMVYPALAWRKLLSSGDYKLMFAKSDDAAIKKYFIVKMSEKEKEEWLARLPKPVRSEQFKEGDKFYPFKDRDLNGEKIDLKLWAGKVIVLNFWFIGCPPCRAEIPDLDKIATQYKDNKDVIFVAIALDEGYEVRDYIKNNPLSYHLLASGRYLAQKLGVNLYPTNVVINRDGKVAYSSQGGSPANPGWIKKTINEALASPVTVNTTTAAQ